MAGGDELVTCPSCDQDSLQKKISAAGFRLKGGGWYETDLKSGGRKNVSADDKSSSSGRSSSSESSSSSTTSSDKSAKSTKSSSSE